MVSTPGRSVLDALTDRAVHVPSKRVHAHVARLRERNPEASPARILELLEKEYLRFAQSTGGAVGAAAALPVVGTTTAVVLTGSNVATFFAASAIYTLAVAEVHGVGSDDVARRRALLLASLSGQHDPLQGVAPAVGQGAAYWGRAILTSMPTSTITQVNKMLGRRVVRGVLARQGTLALGRLVPFGIGAGIGVVGATALARRVIGQSRRAFGPPPVIFGAAEWVVPTASLDAAGTASLEAAGTAGAGTSKGTGGAGGSDGSSVLAPFGDDHDGAFRVV